MNRRTVSILFSAALIACGGGGASVDLPADPTSPTDPGNPANPVTPANPANPATPSSPSGPSAVTITTPGTTFTPASVSITPGSTVTWNITGATHNVTFGSAKPTGGDIPDTGSGGSVARTFPNAGTFDYQCTRHSGMAGRVVVSDGAANPGNPTTPNEGVVVLSTTSGYSPERVEIAPGGIVTWDIPATGGSVIFDEEGPLEGNISESATARRTSRTFSTEGDYDYHNSRNPNLKGRIRVR